MAWNRGINFGLLSGDSDATRWGLIVYCAGDLGLGRLVDAG
jgi:hypothetical protein